MMAGSAIAGYLPEKLIIRLGPEIQIIDQTGTPVAFPTAATFAVFMHEYMHYFHNISTVSGLAGFVNTLELWRLFRLTMESNGFSNSSAKLDGAMQEHLGKLLKTLIEARRNHRPALQTVVSPASIDIHSVALEAAIEDQGGPVLSALVCEAEVKDSRGRTERCRAVVGTLEIMEAAAWLLERRLASALDPLGPEFAVPVFPYQVVSAVAEHLIPGMSAETVLACALAALQSSDPADALMQVLKIAKQATDGGTKPLTAVRDAAAVVIANNEHEVLERLSAIESEFSGNGIMAVAIRSVLYTARKALDLRRDDPFFETSLVDGLAQRSLTIDALMKELPSCAVLQVHFGRPDELRRDTLASFYPLDADGSDPEDGLRVIHAIFDFVGRHLDAEAIAGTREVAERPCPFYSCCALQLRKTDAAICSSSPWRAADWWGWDEGGRCWYGTAVAITRPPATDPRNGE